MKLLLDSFWRAFAYCFHLRVIWLSLTPLLLMVLLWGALGYFFWAPLLDLVRGALESSTILTTVWGWFESLGLGGLKTVVAPLIVIAFATPLIVMLALVLVALLMAPALVALVAQRRFADLEKRHGGSFLGSLFWSLGSVLLALVALLVSTPLWLVPPLILVLPPLIWGWLTYRVLAFDALAQHASKEERRELFRRHRMPLLAMGWLTGYVGAAPTVVLASGALMVVWFPILVPLAVWIYTLVFTFSSLWFNHFCLAALQALRREAQTAPTTTIDIASIDAPPPPPALPHDSPAAPPVSTP